MSQSQPADPLPALVQDADRRILDALDVQIRNLFWPWDESRCRVCGWQLVGSVDVGCVPGICCERSYRTRRADTPPKYSSDWSAIRLVEDEIERRGLTESYLNTLVPVTLGIPPRPDRLDDGPWLTSDVATVWRASCEQRCKAALSVCGALHDRRTDA